MENLNLINKPESNSQLKVLWWSNALHTGTGYGVQTCNTVFRLKQAGYDVRVAANYGLQGAALDFNGVKQYPTSGFSEVGEDALKMVIDNWKPHVLVTLFDVWVGKFSRFYGEDWLSKFHNRWIAYLPVDSEPVAESVAEQAGKAYKAVAMSLFGQRELLKAGVKAEYIQHGVDTQTFKPSTDKQVDKIWLEKHSTSLNPAKRAVINPNDFVIGVNKANKDRERADYARMLTAFKLFLDDNPDARKDAKLYLHTWVDFTSGTPIRLICKQLDIEANVKFTPDYYMLCGLTPADLARQYGAFDVLMNLARGEGFGVPILEAQACGVPCIATDYTAMTELVQGHGWLVPPYASDYHGGCRERNGLNSFWAVPDEYKAADAITQAYNHPETIQQYSKVCTQFAQGYDFDKAVMPKWRELLSEVESELGMFGNAANKDAAFAALYQQAVDAKA